MGMEGLKDKEKKPKCCKFIECQHSGNKYRNNHAEKIETEMQLHTVIITCISAKDIDNIFIEFIHQT